MISNRPTPWNSWSGIDYRRLGTAALVVCFFAGGTASGQGFVPAGAAAALTTLVGAGVPGATLRVGQVEAYTSISSAISAASDGDTIEILDAVHTEAGIVVSKSLTIQGQGATATIVQAAASRGAALAGVFSVALSKTVTLRDMTIRHGRTLSGAGIYCDSGSTVTVDSCIVSQNDATVDGGGIASNAGSNLTLLDTTIRNNSAIGLAGGVSVNVVVNSTISRSVISGNIAGSNGGGVFFIGGPGGVNSTIVNTTISGNTANLSGGGMYCTTTSVLDALSVTLNAVTVVSNHCDQDNSGVGDGGGLATLLLAGSCTVKNAIIANNYKGGGTGTADDVSGALVSGNYNLIESLAGATITGVVSQNISGQDPNLSSLGDYGGPNRCHLPLSGSPVIDAIPNGTNGMGSGSLNVDQRGITRPYNGVGDMGAVESSPFLTTTTATNATSSTASAGGTIITDGGTAITARGVAWNTTGSPTTAGTHSTDGSGSGNFISSLTGLTGGTTYYYRAYAVTSIGTYYGGEKSFTTSAAVSLPTVTVASASSITATTASSGGNVTSNGGAAVMARGVAWSTAGNPTITGTRTTNGTGMGTFTSNLTGLSPGMTYYVRAYATNSVGTDYSSQISFTTAPTTPTITVASVSSITSTTASSGGNVTSNGGASVTTRGVCWNTSGNPTTSSTVTTNGTGTGNFTSSLTGLSPGTTYYVRAYATNSEGTSYSSQISFKTAATIPTVFTPSISSITNASAAGDTDVADDGGAPVTVRGVAWNTSGTPTISGSQTTDGSGTGAFTSSLTGLAPNTTYFARGYATNSVGTAYSAPTSFTTAASAPSTTTATVTASNVTSISATTATSGGTITNNGGAAITARGVSWNTTGSPTTSDSHTSNGAGTGSFTSSLTNLAPGTTYYVRAYATNSAGTSYSSERTFTTLSAAPTVTATTAFSLMSTSASVGGAITSSGGASISARGIVWNTSGDPTINDHNANSGAGMGSFTSSLTGLSPGTTYYYRAYATNSAGTGYSTQRSFTTPIAKAIVAVPSVSSVDGTFASSDANIVSDGGSRITARGIVWNTTGNPTLDDDGTIDGTGTGDFNSSLSELAPNTTYYVRAYATNAAGTAYSGETSFTTGSVPPSGTTPLPPSITTPSVSEEGVTALTATTAIAGGTVVEDGGAAIYDRGVVWNTTVGPTLRDSFTSEGEGVGGFTSSLAGLAPNTTYYVRVYATNSTGTTYSSEVSFTTPAALPTLVPAEVASISATTASVDGEIMANGGDFITVRGVCWNTTGSPSTGDDCTSDGTGMGSFTSSLIGLLPGTTYYVRGYGSNSAGTAYSSEVSFTTAALSEEPAPPELSVIVSARTLAVIVGNDITFDIDVENVGDADAEQLVVTIPLPENTDFVSAELLDAQQTSQVNVVDSAAVITFQSLAAGEMARIELILNALVSGAIHLTVTASDAEQNAAAVGEADVTVTSEDRIVQIVNTVPTMCGAGATFGMIGAALLMPGLALTRRRAAR
jgi:hypothetical protein